MPITNIQFGTNIQEIAAGIYWINTPIQLPDAGAFSFNQYLIDDEPLLFHAGFAPCSRSMQRLAHVTPVTRLRHIAFSMPVLAWSITQNANSTRISRFSRGGSMLG